MANTTKAPTKAEIEKELKETKKCKWGIFTPWAVINNDFTSVRELENKVDANVFISDIYEKIDSKYDLIITNPPIRAGKSVYLTILNQSFNYLNDTGELWFVMRNNHGVKTVVKNLNQSYNAEILKKESGYYIVKVTRK